MEKEQFEKMKVLSKETRQINFEETSTMFATATGS
jgi:hypothetical protein